MYTFHYKWAVNKYANNIKLCMTDTDSLLYKIDTTDVYEDMEEELHLFDIQTIQLITDATVSLTKRRWESLRMR